MKLGFAVRYETERGEQYLGPSGEPLWHLYALPTVERARQVAGQRRRADHGRGIKGTVEILELQGNTVAPEALIQTPARKAS